MPRYAPICSNVPESTHLCSDVLKVVVSNINRSDVSAIRLIVFVPKDRRSSALRNLRILLFPSVICRVRTSNFQSRRRCAPLKGSSRSQCHITRSLPSPTIFVVRAVVPLVLRGYMHSKWYVLRSLTPTQLLIQFQQVSGPLERYR
jgi:hypothetical protein